MRCWRMVGVQEGDSWLLVLPYCSFFFLKSRTMLLRCHVRQVDPTSFLLYCRVSQSPGGNSLGRNIKSAAALITTAP